MTIFIMDFLTLENNIENYISQNFNDYLGDELPAIDSFVDDFIDLDKYKKSNILFYDFQDFSFTDLSFESRDVSGMLHVYFVVRNASSSVLKQRAAGYTTAFYNFFYDETKCNRNFNGLTDLGIISSVSFYNAAEANTGIKVVDIAININLED